MAMASNQHKDDEKKMDPQPQIIKSIGSLGLTAILGGGGGFAVVYRGYDTNQKRDVAVKEVDLSKGPRKGRKERAKKLKQEIDVLKKCQHQNVVSLLDQIDKGNTRYLVFEFVGGGNLQKFLSRNKYPLENKDAQRFAQQISAALFYMHSKGIIHRKLAPNNILMVEPELTGTLKISDFAEARFKVERDGKTFTQTYVETAAFRYMAPEIMECQGNEAALKYRTCVDLWSFGIILHEMLTKKHPFEIKGAVTLQSIKSKELELDPKDNADSNELLTKLLSKDPDAREWAAVEDNKWLK